MAGSTVFKCVVYCFGLLVLGFSSSMSIADVAPGSYSHKESVAYLLLRDPGNYDQVTVAKVDWEGEEITELTTGERARYLSVNHDRTLLAYTYQKPHDYEFMYVHFIRAEDGSEVFSLRARSGSAVRWAVDRNRALYWDKRADRIYDIDVDQGSVMEVEADRAIWYSDWSHECECFRVQYGEDSGADLHEVYRVTRDRLIKESSTKTLTVSPDEEVYFRSEPVREMRSEFAIYDYRSDEELYRYYAVGPIGYRQYVLWESSILYVVGFAPIDIEDGQVLNHSWYGGFQAMDRHGLGDESDDTSELPKRSVRASSWSRYILEWNKDREMFEVCDLKNDRHIREYDKFWSGMEP